MTPPKAPPYRPLSEMAPELLEVVQGQAVPVLETGHLVKVNVPRRGAEAPASPSPSPGTAPVTYPKTLQQLLAGPKPNLSGNPGVGPSCRKQTETLNFLWTGHHCECWGSLHPIL